MVFAFPFRVCEALPIIHCTVLSLVPNGASKKDCTLLFHPGHCREPSLTGDAVVLLIATSDNLKIPSNRTKHAALNLEGTVIVSRCAKFRMVVIEEILTRNTQFKVIGG